VGVLPEVAQLEFATTTITDTVTDLGKSFMFDFKKGDFVLLNGKLVSTQGIEALKVWIEKILRTEKFRFQVYTKDGRQDEYGVTLEDLIIGKNYPLKFFQAEVRREVTTALLRHPLIQSITKWTVVKGNPLLSITCTVNLNNGTSFEQEVNF